MSKKLLLGAALSALTLSGAFAQAPSGPRTAPAAPTESGYPQPGQTKPALPSQSASGATDFVMSQKPDQWLASSFKGTEVLGSDGEKLGQVSDILFDKTGKVEAYVVSMGGFLGMGAKQVAIAPSSFTVETGAAGEPDKLKLSLSKSELEQADNFQPYRPHTATTTGAAPRSSPFGGGMYQPAR